MRDFEADWVAAMRCGDYPAAWAINDAVLAAREPATRDDPALPYHLRWVWDGRRYAGRDVLVRCYHGLGDTLQYARYWPGLRRLARSLTVEVQPELLPLLAHAAGPDRLVPFILDAPHQSLDCDIEVMELAHALRLPPDASPAPYLAVPPAVADACIGLCWQAGGWDADRSIPEAAFAALASLRPAVSLQQGATGLKVLNPDGTGDILATARLIAGLDLVVTVDTMVAHLAGALGRPVWLLLKHEADWRWGCNATTPWYPSMRLFRQTEPGDWAGVMAQVWAALRAAC